MTKEEIQSFIDLMGGLKAIPDPYLMELLIQHPWICENKRDRKRLFTMNWSESNLSEFRKVAKYLSDEEYKTIQRDIFARKLKK